MAFPRVSLGAIGALLVVRLQAAFWSTIADCDETYNYWEPLHYVLQGKGLQTWEYSPEFALRSYSYLWLHGLPAKLVGLLVENNGVTIFYTIRALLAVTCALLEYRMYKVIKRKCGASIGNMWLFFQLVSPGMFISSAALLPSSFAMYITMATMADWMSRRPTAVIAVTAFSGLIGWPFAVIVNIPFVLELLIKQRKWVEFTKNAFFYGALFGVPIVLVDSYYFGKLTVAALNIVRYNIFTSHGPGLYGVEPVSFYVKNLFLNQNLALLLSLLYPVLAVLAAAIGLRGNKGSLSPLAALWKLSPLFLWLAVFAVQPHKEERFMFPVYPLFSLGAALTLGLLSSFTARFLGAKKSAFLNRPLVVIIFGVTLLLGLSRILAVCINYRAPVAVLGNLQPTARETNLCYGKEWYRFPSSFLLPAVYRVRFIPSSFTGMLPAYYQETADGSRMVHDYFNDQNIGHKHMQFELSRCDFLIDLDTGEPYEKTASEPNYSADTDTWAVVESADFLLASRSSALGRAFYLPSLSSRYSVYGRYNLLKRVLRA
ncbi:alpha-1,2-mannosyltransferase ALG9 isoform X1 [Anopheles bellator]|uniref:alpha-1,2-mannosyltransferase ALG9 isoform X1 n=1 Tax=Anopheles bellator TaxID=139047 RepID=UPI0026498ACA|nr:alpha-1,2-mannosyltransferase ALG9 isoform X1 [Anopheles bellator]